MRNQVIRDRFAALKVLADRVLPSDTAVNKVSTLLRARYGVPFDATEEGRKMTIRRIPLPEGWEGDRLPVAVAEARQNAVDDLMKLGQSIKKIPEHLRLTPDDMPRKLKGENGDENAGGVAAIIHMLGTLYVPGRSKEEDANLDIKDGEQEDESAGEDTLTLQEVAAGGRIASAEQPDTPAEPAAS